MNNPLVLGNWKMYKTCAEAVKLARRIAEGLRTEQVEVGVIPPFTALSDVSRELISTSVVLGAQDVYPASEGAFTGEISPLMLKELGVLYVLCGHSERRHVMGESDEFVGKKVIVVAQAGMEPLLCVGEKLEERDKGETEMVLLRQLTKGLAGFPANSENRLTVAYEPVWAIGTGRVATPQQVEEAHNFIRDWLKQNLDLVNPIRIIYGGSVKPENAPTLFNIPNLDGFLVGGASLDADPFLKIIAVYG